MKNVKVLDSKDVKNVDLIVNDIDVFKCPYDVNNIGRCHFPRSESGDCTCILRHNTSSREYIN